MSDQIENHRVLEFNGRVEHLLQQQGSRFRMAVSESSYNGKSAEVVRQFGQVTAVRKQDRHADLPTVEVPHSRRWVDPRRYEFAEFEDQADRLRVMLSSSPEYAKAFAMSLGRAMDDEIIEAATGSAKTGETGGSTETFDTSAFQVAAGGVGMTIDKLRAAKRLFRAEENDLDNDPLYLAISAQEEEDLLNETQMISLDYNDRAVLVEGRLTRFMGFNFIHSERLADDGTTRSCFAWVKSGLHLGIWEGIRTPIDWIPRKQAWQTAGIMDIGATRTQQGKVVEILSTIS